MDVNPVPEPLWISLGAATRLANSANLILVVSLAVGALATAVSIWMGNIKEEYAQRTVDHAREITEHLTFQRSLRSSDMATVRPILSPFQGTRAMVLCVKDDEAFSLAQDIIHALEFAGWDVKLWKWEAMTPVVGVRVYTRPNADADASKAAEALVTALAPNLSARRFEWSGPWEHDFGPLLGSPVADSDRQTPIRIIVGSKP